MRKRRRGGDMAGDALDLYEPIDTPKPVDRDIWVVDGPVIRMAWFGTSIPFTTRMAVVRLGNGGLWLWSPLRPSAPLRARIDALGPVSHLVSPNRLHYAHLAACKAAWPDATVWASPGVRTRARSQGAAVAFDRDLGDPPPPDWAADLDQTIFRGSSYLPEIVFFHRASATLIVADLIENFEPPKVAPRWRWLMRLGGAVDPDGKMPLDLRMTYLCGRREARASLARLLAWQPRRLILAHGRWYERDATAELRRAFRWLGRH
jgi:hypothetical protein